MFLWAPVWKDIKWQNEQSEKATQAHVTSADIILASHLNACHTWCTNNTTPSATNIDNKSNNNTVHKTSSKQVVYGHRTFFAQGNQYKTETLLLASLAAADRPSRASLWPSNVKRHNKGLRAQPLRSFATTKPLLPEALCYTLSRSKPCCYFFYPSIGMYNSYL